MLQAIYIYLCINNLPIDWSLCASFGTSVLQSELPGCDVLGQPHKQILRKPCRSFPAPAVIDQMQTKAASHCLLLLSDVTTCLPAPRSSLPAPRSPLSAHHAPRSRLAFTFGHIFGSQSSALQVAFVNRTIRFTFTVCRKVFVAR